MEELRHIEAFLQVSLQLGLFILIVTLASMQAIKPYLRSAVQSTSLRALHYPDDAFHLWERLGEGDDVAIVRKQYPELAAAMVRADVGRRPDDEVHPSGSAWLGRRTALAGIPNDMFMRIVQNSARTLIERPSRDPRGYEALTRDAALPDRIAARLLEHMRIEDYSVSGEPGESFHPGYDDAPYPSRPEARRGRTPPAEAAALVRANVAAAVERKLDALQVEIIARWRSLGRWMAVTIGIAAALFAGVASGILSAPGIASAAILTVLLVAGAAMLPAWLDRNSERAMDRFDGAFLAKSLGTMIRLLDPFAPLAALAIGIALLRSLGGDYVTTMIAVGAVSGLIASLVYDAAKAYVVRR